MRAKLIYTRGGGRLGNQVLRFAHWLAWAQEERGSVEVRNLAFWPYAKYFATWQAHPGCVYPLRVDGWNEIARALQCLPGWARHRIDWRVQQRVQACGRPAIALNDAVDEAVDLADPAFLRSVRASGTATCAGWRIAGWPLLARHQAAVRALLQPARDYAAKADDFIGGLRLRHGFIIGVHVRQGDYREWHDGRFLFPISQYAQWISQALALHADRNPAVVVVSDASLTDLGSTAPSVYQLRETRVMDDWSTLSRCDVVLCAPSTFPATAAFVGARPLWPVVRRDQVLELAQVIPDGLLGAARHPEFSLAVK